MIGARPEPGGQLTSPFTARAVYRNEFIERTEGNPFFLEEGIRALVDAHTLVGEPGSYRLTEPLSHVRMPATVQAARVPMPDRVSEGPRA